MTQLCLELTYNYMNYLFSVITEWKIGPSNSHLY